jgi:hypothetical protein
MELKRIIGEIEKTIGGTAMSELAKWYGVSRQVGTKIIDNVRNPERCLLGQLQTFGAMTETIPFYYQKSQLPPLPYGCFPAIYLRRTFDLDVGPKTKLMDIVDKLPDETHLFVPYRHLRNKKPLILMPNDFQTSSIKLEIG